MRELHTYALDAIDTNLDYLLKHILIPIPNSKDVNTAAETARIAWEDNFFEMTKAVTSCWRIPVKMMAY